MRSMSSYDENVLKIAGDYQYDHCRIVRAFVSVPELASDGDYDDHVTLATADVPYITNQGEKCINPNSDFNPRVALFVWMEGRDENDFLCHWIVRFRLCDGSGFLRNQDYYQLKSLTAALTGDPESIEVFDGFQMEDNDPLPHIAAISRRLNACRDARFSAADAIQQTAPIDPMVEKPKTYHAWAFKAEKPSNGYHLWDDCSDLEFLRFGNVIPIRSLGSSLVDRLPYLHFTADLTVLTDGPDETLIKADTYKPMIDIEPIKNAGGDYNEGGLLPSAGFSKIISYQLINWAVRRGYDQLAGLWNSAKSWGGSPFVPGPDFWCYWPVPIKPIEPYFGDDNWRRTDTIREYWRALPYAGGNLRGTNEYAPVVLPKIKSTPAIDKLIDFGLTSEVRISKKLYGKKVII